MMWYLRDVILVLAVINAVVTPVLFWWMRKKTRNFNKRFEYYGKRLDWCCKQAKCNEEMAVNSARNEREKINEKIRNLTEQLSDNGLTKEEREKIVEDIHEHMRDANKIHDLCQADSKLGWDPAERCHAEDLFDN